MTDNFLYRSEPMQFTAQDFREWALKDLVSNAARGSLAEFIVARALGVEGAARIEWDAYDLLYKGKKIEVKSSAYIQSWNKKTMLYAKPSFGIGQKRGWYADTNTIGELKRHADIYVFCLLTCKDWDKINPLDLDQWEFFVIPTYEIDEKIPSQKSIGITSLRNTFGKKPISYSELQKACNTAIKLIL